MNRFRFSFALGWTIGLALFATPAHAQFGGMSGPVEGSLKPAPWSEMQIPEGDGRGITFTTSGQQLVSWTNNYDVLVWDFEEDRLETFSGVKYRQDREYLNKVVPYEDGRLIALSSSPHSFTVWPVSIEGEPYHWKTSRDWLNAADISANGKFLAVATSSLENRLAQVDIIDLAKRQSLHTFQIPTRTSNGVTAVAFSPDESQIAIAWGNVVRRYSLETWKIVATYPTQKATVGQLTWEPTGRYLAAICGTRYADISYGPDDRPLKTHGDGDFNVDLRVHVFSGQTDEEVTTLGGYAEPGVSIAFFPVSMDFRRQAITVGGATKLRWWNVENGGTIRNGWVFGNGNEMHVAISKDGSYIAILSGDHKLDQLAIYPTDRDLLEILSDVEKAPKAE